MLCGLINCRSYNMFVVYLPEVLSVVWVFKAVVSTLNGLQNGA